MISIPGLLGTVFSSSISRNSAALLFFPDVLGGKSAEERGEIVRNELIKHGLETQN